MKQSHQLQKFLNIPRLKQGNNHLQKARLCFSFQSWPSTDLKFPLNYFKTPVNISVHVDFPPKKTYLGQDQLYSCVILSICVLHQSVLYFSRISADTSRVIRFLVSSFWQSGGSWATEDKAFHVGDAHTSHKGADILFSAQVQGSHRQKKVTFLWTLSVPPLAPRPHLRTPRGVFFLKARTSDSRRLERKHRKDCESALYGKERLYLGKGLI